jgi:hypothetical protein
MVWECLNALASEVPGAAGNALAILKRDPHYPFLHVKRVGRFWSARVGLHDRALGVEEGDDLIRFWIGHHADYGRLNS